MNIFSLSLTLFVLSLIVVFVLIDILRLNPQRPLTLKYRLRRFLNWFSLGLSYSAIYIGRYNFSLLSVVTLSNGKNLLSTAQFGWIMSIGYWTYAFISPWTGSIGDYLGPKPCVVIGVLGSGLTNILLGITLIGHDSPAAKVIPPTLLFGFFNGLNFIFQSMSTGSVNKINSGWYRRSEIGVFGGIFSAVLATAYFFTLNVGEGILNSPLSWNFLFLAPGALLVFTGILCLVVVTEKPYQCGWDVDLTDPVEHHLHTEDNHPEKIQMSMINSFVEHHSDFESDDSNEDPKKKVAENSSAIDSNNSSSNNNIIIISEQWNDTNMDTIDIKGEMMDNRLIINSEDDHSFDDKPIQVKTKLTFKQAVKEMVKEVMKKENIQPLLSKDNIMNAISLFCVGWIKEGFIAWYTPFLNDKFGPNPSQTLLTLCTAGVSIGAMTGGFLCGLLSDLAFNSKRSPSLFIFFFFLNVLIAALYFLSDAVASTITLITLMVIMFGTNNVLSVTALLDLGTVRNAALMAGLLTMFQYIASGFSGFFLGYIVQEFGYGVWILSMIPFSLAAMVMQFISGVQELLFWKKWIKLGKNNAVSSLHSETQIKH
ncbi:hypothetical protein PPL_09063 [Heterostelium album PN500]|uniref:Major facilitator superfamily (MFS) profile domain-containing protein n=1 Tax=Heterostelium pallidum (strain ATCC 26659 / Pp 5 / PN500) TaxID=670386 RepID=D3BKI2_HETP5|nr:hypothetical protein PPL_09063 [Heterostelium album PN500]EFA78412.1 hypothetical protein PPL_09063 [Heterostelium album PN500]|eukprot:XP_020430537.1 hypothetical protein PPL_09063 [Heterostelium album PN500]